MLTGNVTQVGVYREHLLSAGRSACPVPALTKAISKSGFDMSNALEVYGRLPVALQNVACSIEGLRIKRRRFDGEFHQLLESAERRDRFSNHEAFAYRDERIRSFVLHAARTAPYYQRLFAEMGIRPEEVSGLDDLAKLPVLTKAEVQAAPQDFMSSSVPRGARMPMHTSGTTGTALIFITTRTAHREQYATWWRHYRRHGLTLGTWCAYFGGRPVVPPNQTRPPFWRVNRPGRQILFSPDHVTPANLTHQLEELRRVRPPWIHGFPPQLALLAEHALETGFDLGYQPRWITTGAENLMASHRRVIEAAFGLSPFEHYGLTEAVANISQCPSGRFHVDEDFAAVEFVPTDDGDAFKIIGTNLSNPAMPLLRYDTGDLVQVSQDSCDCGLPGRIVKSLDGREDVYVTARNGARMRYMDTIFKDMFQIREAQIRQATPGSIEVRIVKNSGYGETHEATLLKEFRNRLGQDFDISIKYVPAIERTRSGKLRFVIRDAADS